MADKAALSLNASELDLLPRSYGNYEDIDAEVDRLVTQRHWPNIVLRQNQIPVLFPGGLVS